MKRLLAATTIAAAICSPVASARPSAFYASSIDAESFLRHSDWGDQRGVASADCNGTGAYRKEYGEYVFARFRCDLADKQFARIGHVTVVASGPEAFRVLGFVPPRCSS